jgi:hypothetical protein
MCVEAAQPLKDGFGSPVTRWFEPLVTWFRSSAERWEHERLLRTIRRGLDDRSLADIGLNRLPGPMDAVVNVTVTLLGAPTYKDEDSNACNDPACPR